MIDLSRAPWRRVTLPLDPPQPMRAPPPPAEVVVRRRDAVPGSLTFRAKGEAVDVAAISLRISAMSRASRARATPSRAPRPAQRRVSAKTVLNLLAPGPLTITELHDRVGNLMGLMATIHTLQARGKVVMVGERVMRTAHSVVPTDPALLLRVLAKHGKAIAPAKRSKKRVRPPIKATLRPPVKSRHRPVTAQSVEPGTWSEIVERAKERIARERLTRA
ncbi:MAG: hypothetical protein QOE90_3038 [Thermoplasmata archaeon]|jgi:hypothetical protein|nr:hypothetical protein [Thermoplasmata archaeon]